MKSLSRRRKAVIVLGTVGLLLLGVAGQGVNLVRWYHRQHAAQPMQWGMTFSAPYAKYLGLDPRDTLTAMLEQLKVKHLRLMSYWNEIEPSNGQYDFSELDFEMAAAKAHGADVSLVVGERQPRWPECYEPGWVTNLNTAQKRQFLAKFITEVVNRYKNHNELTSWQIENEALNSFGNCPPPDRKWLAQELNLVQRLDPGRPAAMTASDEMGWPVGTPKSGNFGISVYYEQWYHLGPFSGKFVYPLPAWWQSLRAAVTERWLHQAVYIHELQAEPWGPTDILQIPVSRQLSIYNSGTLNTMTRRAQATGIKKTYLWGGEWWYWLLTKQHNPSLWQAGASLYANNK